MSLSFFSPLYEEPTQTASTTKHFLWNSSHISSPSSPSLPLQTHRHAWSFTISLTGSFLCARCPRYSIYYWFRTVINYKFKVVLKELQGFTKPRKASLFTRLVVCVCIREMIAHLHLLCKTIWNPHPILPPPHWGAVAKALWQEKWSQHYVHVGCYLF